MLDKFTELIGEKDVEILKNVDSACLCSMRCGGKIKAVVIPENADKLIYCLQELSRLGLRYFVAGGMTNTLVKDSGFDGVLIKCDRINSKNVAENGVFAECGCSLSGLIRYCASFSLGGCDGLAHIPGTVGGAVYGNSGAYGSSISDCFVFGRFYSPVLNKLVTLKREELDFSYRYSRLKREGLILIDCFLSFIKLPRQRIEDGVSRLQEERRKSQPLGVPSLGSVFKRAGNVGAGYYLDRCGLRGFRLGGAAFSEKHAGFIVNLGNASANDVIKLIEIGKNAVLEKFGVVLEEEIKIIP